MASYSRSGWMIKTAIGYGRRFHIDSPADPERHGEILTPAMVQKEIIDRMTWIDNPDGTQEDMLEPGERVWLFSEKRRDGTCGPHRIRFVGPNLMQIRRIKADEAKKRQTLKDARRERAEIARETCTSAKSRKSQSTTAPSTSRRL